MTYYSECRIWTSNDIFHKINFKKNSKKKCIVFGPLAGNFYHTGDGGENRNQYLLHPSLNICFLLV